MEPIVLIRILFFAVTLLSFVLCMIIMHLGNALLFYVLVPSLFTFSMQWAEYLSSSLALLLAHLYCPQTVMKVSFADESTERKFLEYQKDRSLGSLSSDVVICNHQLYTDWIYIWALLTHLGKGGNVKITLKKSLQWIPIAGWGMKLIGFVFLSRKWSVDRSTFLRRISRLVFFKPFSFLIFVEGTTLCESGLKKSKEFAEREKIVPSTDHVLIPRTLGMYTSVLAFKDTIEGIWDLTLCYSDMPSYTLCKKFPEQLYGLASLFGERRAPKNIHFVLKFIPIKDIKSLIDDEVKFENWLRKIYADKDLIMRNGYVYQKYPTAAITLPVIHSSDTRNVLVAFSIVIMLFVILLKFIYP